ncbi:hypothetical protein DS831_04610 [Bombilactobacillus bombi]|uniref:DUF1642 domain-containing protein n=1 Tax=Bombilactobacillus bombi TaxID=1303590 RepID=A0A3R6WAS7_9LACO|nr:DUF1642 domain-containing protein [Bombilactobacillus bombi]RHW51306.1 hypothetical protein DS831_04610 [Bombilactobacillus bombi]
MDRVKVPTYVSDYINLFKQNNCNFIDAIRAPFFFKYFESPKISKTRKWLLQDKNSEIFARAWVDGYETEEELYYIRFCPNDRAAYLKVFKGDLSDKSKWKVTSNDETWNLQTKFTTDEINNYFPQFKPFTVKVGDEDE